MKDSFTKKRLELTINIGAGEFGEEIASTTVLSGLRMTADIALAGGVSPAACQLRVWGLTESRMNQLTTIGPVATELLGKNSISLSAGDDSGMTLVYQGAISEAFPDYSATPSVCLNIIAHAGMLQALKPVPPSSFSANSVDVAFIMAELAKEMGFGFRNYGVDVKLSRPYLKGTLMMQARACARAADIWMTVDKGQLIIWPKDGPIGIGDIPLISPSTGLVGYPTASSSKISFVTIFNPSIQYPGLVQLDSSLPMGKGTFSVFNMNHSLSSEMPGGPWFSIVDCTKYE